MQLYQQEKTFYQFLAALLKSRLNFEHFEKNMTLIAFVFRKLGTPKTLSDKCLKQISCVLITSLEHLKVNIKKKTL